MFSRNYRGEMIGWVSKKHLGGLMAAVAVTALLPTGSVFAAEEAGNENKTNEGVLNYLENEDYIFAAERIPTNKWETPANIHVITAQEIEENHYKSVAEALSHVNGVSVILSGAVTSGEAQMNGGGRVLLLINGYSSDPCNVHHK